MPGKPYPPNVLEQASGLLDAWGKIDDQMTFGPLNSEAFTEELQLAREIEYQLVGLVNQLIDLRNQRDAVNQSIWDKLKRVRAGVKGAYGDDSPQYELIGGTRMSDRKSSRRRPKAPALSSGAQNP